MVSAKNGKLGLAGPPSNVPRRGAAVEDLWNELSVRWGLYRDPGLEFQDCSEGVGLFKADEDQSYPLRVRKVCPITPFMPCA